MWLLALLAGLGLVAQIEPQPAREDAAKVQKAQKAAPRHVLTRAPKLVHFEKAVYPDDAKKAGKTGSVVLLITISAKGTVTDVKVKTSLSPSLDAAAEAAAHELLFTPAEVDGKPAPVQIEFRYVFTLAPPKPKPPPKEAKKAPPPVSLEGRILVRGRRNPIDGAIVKSGDAATTTGSDGRFSLRLPPGEHQMVVEAPGYHTFRTDERTEKGKVVKVTYYLLSREMSPFETVVRAKKEKKDVTVVTLQRPELERVPGTFGDPLRVLENLPGMSRAPFIGGQLLVRGANPRDSGVYFDGVQVPLLYHFGGLTSVINPEFIDQIDFRPGGFGARYGRAIAGIVDVSSRRLTGKLARGSAKIDLMDTSLFYRQPLGKHVAIGLAVRRSYVDAILPIFFSLTGLGGGITLAPVYTDYQAKLDWDPNPAHQLTLFVFGSDDTFHVLTPRQSSRSFGISFQLHTGFHRLMVSDRWQINKKLVLKSMPFLGMTIQGAGGGQVGGGLGFDFTLTRYEAGWREDLSYHLSKKLTLRTGLDLYLLRASGNATAPVGGDLLAFPAPIHPYPTQQKLSITSGGSDLAAYLEATWKPVPGLEITPGLRPELYVFATKVHPVLDPRIAVRWTVHEGTTLKAAAGTYHINPNIFTVNTLTGNPDLVPEGATQYVLGVEQKITDLINVDVEGFLNLRYDLAVSSFATKIVNGKAVSERYNNDGKGRAFGLEVLLRHEISKHFFGWIAYTLMKSEQRSHPGDPFVPTNYDQTNILTIVASWKIGWGLELGGRFRLVTGNPYTPVTGSIHDLDTDGWDPIYGPRNSARLPTFNQLDVRLDWTSVFDTWTLDVFVDLLNAYNQQNIEDFQYDYRYRQKIGFSLLPIFPVLGVKGEF